MRRTVALAVLIGAAGCGGDAGAPLLIADGISFGRVPLYWTHPSGQATGGYALEVSVAGGPFQVSRRIGPAELLAVYIVSPDVPERSDLGLRVRALPDDSGTRASNVISYHHGLMPPLLVCDVYGSTSNCGPSSGGFQLSWTLPSKVADGILLQRRTVFLSPPPTDWQTLPVSLPSTSYLDADLDRWRLGGRFEYRLISTSPGEQSDPALANTAWSF